jgi:membrane-associated phospholipid phosphatase
VARLERGRQRYPRGVHEVGPLTSLAAQRVWDEYRAGDLEAGSGSSAMPSMHVAMATLFALRGWRSGRTPGMALTGFAAVSFAGSVQLGWHYAVDGYMSAALMAALWHVVGRWTEPRRAGPASVSVRGIVPRSATRAAFWAPRRPPRQSGPRCRFGDRAARTATRAAAPGRRPSVALGCPFPGEG